MKGLRVVIVEEANKGAFVQTLNACMETRDVFSVKLQRNLFYAGIGSSAGHTPGSTQDLRTAELDESYVGFVVYKPSRMRLRDHFRGRR